MSNLVALVPYLMHWNIEKETETDTEKHIYYLDSTFVEGLVIVVKSHDCKKHALKHT